MDEFNAFVLLLPLEGNIERNIFSSDKLVQTGNHASFTLDISHCGSPGQTCSTVIDPDFFILVSALTELPIELPTVNRLLFMFSGE